MWELKSKSSRTAFGHHGSQTVVQPGNGQKKGYVRIIGSDAPQKNGNDRAVVTGRAGRCQAGGAVQNGTTVQIDAVTSSTTRFEYLSVSAVKRNRIVLAGHPSGRMPYSAVRAVMA